MPAPKDAEHLRAGSLAPDGGPSARPPPPLATLKEPPIRTNSDPHTHPEHPRATAARPVWRVPARRADPAGGAWAGPAAVVPGRCVWASPRVGPRRVCRLLRPRILVLDGEMAFPHDLDPLLEVAVARGAALLLVAAGFSEPVLERLRGAAGLRGAAHAAAAGPDCSARLADFAAVAGAEVLVPRTGAGLPPVALDQLGRARAARIAGGQTRLHPYPGHVRADARACELRGRLAQPSGAALASTLRDRLAFLLQAEADAAFAEDNR